MSTTSRQDDAFLHEVIGSTTLETAIDWISKNLSPDDVFFETDLKAWAASNGWEET